MSGKRNDHKTIPTYIGAHPGKRSTPAMELVYIFDGHINNRILTYPLRNFISSTP